MAITMKDFGSNGRLANQLFQFAALNGIAHDNETDLILPDWNYTKYFNLEQERKIKEDSFEYNAILVEKNENVDIRGYLQSEKYWRNNIKEIKEKLTFTQDFIDDTKSKLNNINLFNGNPTVAIHIRRGDYLENGNYKILPISYYYQALKLLFDKYLKDTETNIIIFSDDISYCKTHFESFSNIHFSEGNSDIEDLCLISQCDHFILSNSSFSWWGAYIGEKPFSMVIRPNYLFDGELAKKYTHVDFYQPNWRVYDHEIGGIIRKIDLRDTTFIIPISYDHSDRKENLDLCIKHIQRYFDTNIIVGEQGTNVFGYVADEEIYGAKYMKFDYSEFHRTKMLNEMTKAATTNIIANWDCDIFISPLQLMTSVQQITDGTDVSYPYDGRFCRIPRTESSVKLIRNFMDVGIFGQFELPGDEPTAVTSVGGAVIYNKESFIKVGMENENFISFAPEDKERYYRFKTLGLNIQRVKGKLFHLNHFTGTNSSLGNPYYRDNNNEYKRIRNMSKQELKEEVSKWVHNQVQ